MEVLAEGKINLLYANQGQVHYFVQSSTDKIIHQLPYIRTERLVDDGYSRYSKVIESTLHIDTLKILMSNRPAIFPKIEKIQTPDKKSLQNLVNQYNKSSYQTENLHEPTTQVAPTLLREGKINLYVQKGNDNRLQYYIVKTGNARIIELPYETMNDKAYNGISIKSYFTSTQNHIDTLKKYMADAPALANMIDNIKKPTEKNLTQLVDEYNAYVNDQSFEEKHKLKRLPLNIEITPALYFTLFEQEDPMERFGVNVNIGFLQQNTHFFLKTGFFPQTNHTPIAAINNTFQGIFDKKKPFESIKIPFQFEYRLVETQFQPLLAIGYNYYITKSSELLGNWNHIHYYLQLNPVCSPGVNIKMGRRISMRLSTEIEFSGIKPIAWIPTKFVQLGAFIGVQIKL